MTFLIGAANSASGAYEISNSLRFSDTNYLTIDNTAESGEGVNFTFSVWLKMTSYTDGGYQGILSIFKDSDDYFEIYKDNSERLQIGQNINGTSVYYQNQGFDFFDSSAWYHLVVSFNNSASGEVNKIKVYVNGTEISASEGVTNSNPFGDVGLGDAAYDTRIGSYRDNTDPTWNGYMAELNLVAGTTLTADSFGETNDNGVWIPKKYTGSHGENGFYLKFQETGTSQNASGMGADSSGNGNHLAVTGLSSVDVTTDTPSNNFATLNPLNKFGTPLVKDGNLEYQSNSSSGSSMISTICPSTGKWYCEVKAITSTITVGIAEASAGGQAFNIVGGGASRPQIDYSYGGDVRIDESDIDDEATYGANDIIGILLNLDDNEVIFQKNGTSINSGTAYDLHTNTTQENSGFYIQTHTGSGSTKGSFNFGNPAFAISSGNADANGYGNFEFAVPSGYYALCTKNLAEFG